MEVFCIPDSLFFMLSDTSDIESQKKGSFF